METQKQVSPKVGEMFYFNFASGELEGTKSFGRAVAINEKTITTDCGGQGVHEIPKKDATALWAFAHNL